MVDAVTKKTLSAIPLCRINAGPRDAEWTDRLKEELMGLIAVGVVMICFLHRLIFGDALTLQSRYTQHEFSKLFLMMEHAAMMNLNFKSALIMIFEDFFYLFFSILTCAQYVKNNKDNDNDWFKLECNKDGTRYVRMRGNVD